MNLLKHFRKTYRSNYLLAISASLILLSILGSINIMLITQQGMTAGGIVSLLLTTFATMFFLASVLAQFRFKKLYAIFWISLCFQLIMLILLSMN